MPRNSSFILQFFTYCILIGVTYAIIGPKAINVRFKQFPFIVSLSQNTENGHTHHFHICTGTLIRPRSVLTAAHCLTHKTLRDIQIIAGSVNIRDGKKYNPESWITFDQWNQDRNWTYRMNDIAMIILQGEGITDIEPAKIPFIFHNNHDGHTRFKIAGWGETEKGNKVNHLRTAQLLLISNEECSRKGTELKGRNFTVPQNYFCSKAEPYVLSSCGDGGAPIFTVGNYVIGINIGVCPNLEGYPYNPEFLHQNQLNSHLHVSFYSHFIANVWR